MVQICFALTEFSILVRKLGSIFSFVGCEAQRVLSSHKPPAEAQTVEDCLVLLEWGAESACRVNDLVQREFTLYDEFTLDSSVSCSFLFNQSFWLSRD